MIVIEAESAADRDPDPGQESPPSSSSSSIYYLTRGVPTGMALLQGTLGESL